MVLSYLDGLFDSFQIDANNAAVVAGYTILGRWHSVLGWRSSVWGADSTTLTTTETTRRWGGLFFFQENLTDLFEKSGVYRGSFRGLISRWNCLVTTSTSGQSTPEGNTTTTTTTGPVVAIARWWLCYNGSSQRQGEYLRQKKTVKKINNITK